MTSFLRTLVLALTLTWAGGAAGVDTQRFFDDPALQARYENITHELRCLVCQNETIADSNATLAGDLRREVREMIAAGQSDEQISEFMIARYGDFVLYRPRMTRVTFLLWAAPALMLAFGAVAVVRVIRRRAAEAAMEPEGPEGDQS